MPHDWYTDVPHFVQHSSVSDAYNECIVHLCYSMSALPSQVLDTLTGGEQRRVIEQAVGLEAIQQGRCWFNAEKPGGWRLSNVVTTWHKHANTVLFCYDHSKNCVLGLQRE